MPSITKRPFAPKAVTVTQQIPGVKDAPRSILPPSPLSPPGGGGQRGFIYGPSGIGKTSLCSWFDRPGWICDPQELGIQDLIGYGQSPAQPILGISESFDHLIGLCDARAIKKAGVVNLCLDSATGFERQCFMHHCKEYYDDDWTKEGFYSFQSGPKNAAKKDWPRFLNALDELAIAGINVWMLGHSATVTFKNPEGPDYDKFVPYLDKETWQQTHRWASCVFFLNYRVIVNAPQSSQKNPKGKVDLDRSEGRILHTSPSPSQSSKNRFGLDPYIDMGESAKSSAKILMDVFAKAAKQGLRDD